VCFPRNWEFGSAFAEAHEETLAGFSTTLGVGSVFGLYTFRATQRSSRTSVAAEG
jgi:hypothetical protein